MTVQSYDDYMQGVDLSRQMEYYSFNRKTIKQWRKVFNSRGNIDHSQCPKVIQLRRDAAAESS